MSKRTAAKSRQRSLKGQKLRGRQRPRWKILAYSLLAIFAIVGGVYGARQYERWSPIQRTTTWEVRVAPSLASANEPDTIKGISDVVQTAFRFGYDSAKAQTLLKKIAIVSKSDKVHIFRSGIKQITVFGTKATPVLCVGENDPWGVSEDGNLYKFGKYPEGLPKLSGLVDIAALPREDREAGRHQTQDEIRQYLTQALRLVHLLRTNAFMVGSLRFIEHRGFEVSLVDPQLSVVVGYSPFEVKIERMKDLLDQLRLRKRIARRVELDIDGKVFIKE